MLFLIHFHEDGGKKKHLVKNLPFSVGRAESATITINTPDLSDEHARFFLRDNKLHVADLNSDKGIFINNVRTTLSALRADDEIRLGDSIFKIMKAAKPATSKQGPAPMSLSEIEDFFLPKEEEKTALKSKPTRRSEDYGAVEFNGNRKTTSQRNLAKSIKPIINPDSLSADNIKIKQEILQYNKIDADKSRSVMKDDFSQYGGLSRLIIILLFICLAVGSFFVFKWIGQEAMPDDFGAEEETYSEDSESMDR